jgi:flagellar motor switch/type III secretory pathway protein FliN
MSAYAQSAPELYIADDAENIGVAATPNDLCDLLPWLPCELTLDLPVVRFKIRDLAKLKPGTIVETASPHLGDIPLRLHGRLIGWTKLEAVGDRMVARIIDWA